MYIHHFNMRERPFKLVYNPGYLYLSRAHHKALELIADGVHNSCGIFELTGETGTGKTTVCHAFMERRDDNTGAVFISNPRVTPKQLLEIISSELEIESGSGSVEDHMAGLEAWLIAQKNDGKNSLLLIDESQNLSPEVVGLLCELSELEVDSVKLLTIVLVGQSAAETDSDSEQLKQMKEKITGGYSLSPMTWNETREYILHRICISSLYENPKALFSLSALQAVYKSSGGIPRLVNILCNRALIMAYLKNSSGVSSAAVRFSIKEIKGKNPDESVWRIRILQFFCLTTLCLILFLLWRGQDEKKDLIVVHAAQPKPELSRVIGLRYGLYENKTRIVIDIDSLVTFTHTRAGENGLYIDMANTRMGSSNQKIKIMGKRVMQAETKAYSFQSVRIVIQIRPDTSYSVFPLDEPFRIVVDVLDPSAK